MSGGTETPVGRIGRVTVPIPPAGMGEVLVPVRGGFETFGALADRPIGKHTQVLVVDMASARTVMVVTAIL